MDPLQFAPVRSHAYHAKHHHQCLPEGGSLGDGTGTFLCLGSPSCCFFVWLVLVSRVLAWGLFKIFVGLQGSSLGDVLQPVFHVLVQYIASQSVVAARPA